MKLEGKIKEIKYEVLRREKVKKCKYDYNRYTF